MRTCRIGVQRGRGRGDDAMCNEDGEDAEGGGDDFMACR